MSNNRPANAWERPLPRRAPPGLSNTANSSNNNSSKKNTSSSNANAVNTRNAMRYRFVSLQISLVGQSVTLTLKDGSIIQGVFHTFTPFENLDKKHKGASEYKNHYALKAVKVLKDNTSSSTNSEDSISLKDVGHGSTVVIPSEKVVSLYAKSLRLEDHGRNNVNGGNRNSTKNNGLEEHDPFKTDTDISHGGMVKSGDLVHAGNVWTSGGTGSNNASIGGALEDFSLEGGNSKNNNPYSRMNHRDTNNAQSGGAGAGGSNSRGGLFKSSNAPSSSTNPAAGGLNSSSATINDWDQFSANEKKFGIKATFDEDLYTTSLDKSNIDTKKQMEAERLAREIEGTATANIHLAEERGHKIEGDFDEEDLYSGVMVKGGAVKERKQLILKPRTVDKPTSAEGDESKAKSTENQPASAPVKMNYAAAAAASKTDTTTTSKTTAPASKAAETKNTSTVAAAVVSNNSVDENATNNAKEIDVKNEIKDAKNNTSGEEKAEKDEKPKSKLNPNAAKFVFNPSAAEWKPTFGGSTTSSAPPNNNANDQQQAGQPVQQQTEPQHAVGAVPMQPPYMHYPQMHPQMMQAAYQPYAPMPHRVGPPQQYGMMPVGGGGTPMNGGPEGGTNIDSNNNGGVAVDGTTAESDGSQVNNDTTAGMGAETSNEGRNENEAKNVDGPKEQQQPVQNVGNPQQQVPQQHQQQQPVPVSYVSHGGPSGYYQQPGMPIPGRGPMHQYHPQMVGGPQQIPVSLI